MNSNINNNKNNNNNNNNNNTQSEMLKQVYVYALYGGVMKIGALRYIVSESEANVECPKYETEYGKGIKARFIKIQMDKQEAYTKLVDHLKTIDKIHNYADIYDLSITRAVKLMKDAFGVKKASTWGVVNTEDADDDPAEPVKVVKKVSKSTKHVAAAAAANNSNDENDENNGETDAGDNEDNEDNEENNGDNTDIIEEQPKAAAKKAPKKAPAKAPKKAPANADTVVEDDKPKKAPKQVIEVSEEVPKIVKKRATKSKAN